MLQIIETLNIVIDTCELGLKNNNKKIKQKSKTLLQKALGLKHTVCQNELDDEQLQAIDMLMIVWARESCDIQKSNPIGNTSSPSESESI